MDKLKVGDYVVVMNTVPAGTTKYGTIPSSIIGLIAPNMYVVVHFFNGVGNVQGLYKRDELLLVTREDDPELFI